MTLTLDEKRRLRFPAGFSSAQPGNEFEAVFDAETDAIVLIEKSKGFTLAESLKRMSGKHGRSSPKK